MPTDVHQHLWPEPLVAALRRRIAPPWIAPDGELALAGEPPSAFRPLAHDRAARAAAAVADGVDRVLLALSHPLGIDTLPVAQAGPLLDAWHDGAFALGEPFGVWGALALATPPEAEAVDALLDRGAVGVSLPARALASPLGLERLAPVLDRLEARGRPLFVHPGAAVPTLAVRDPWWQAMTAYVADMHAAWLAFLRWGRPAHPELRVLFAMLAGGAPLHLERLEARGGPADAAHDPGLYYDTSSYGVRALDAMVRVVGHRLPRPRPVRRSGRGGRRPGPRGPADGGPHAVDPHARAGRGLRLPRLGHPPRAARRRRTAVTLHAYSPPLWRMGAYEIGAGGELRRHSISYAEELRPFEPAAAV